MPHKTEMGSQPVCHIFTPVGMLGYGFDEDEMHETLEQLVRTGVPTAMVVDSGSTDSGPRKLARGDLTCPRSAYRRDLRNMLAGSARHKVPILIGTAGGAGTNSHVDILTEIVDEISRGHAYKLNIVQIRSEIDKKLIEDRHRSGAITGCGISVPELRQTDIDDATVVVAQMGMEPFLQAINDNPDFDIIIGGRAYDPAPYAAFAHYAARMAGIDSVNEEERESFDGGLWHMGKIMECGALCATPKSRSAYATMYADGSFDFVPTGAGVSCTTLSVASHTMYEKTRPDLLHGPGGWLDLNGSEYEMLDHRTCRVRGSRFHASVDNGKPYQVKLEGAGGRGFRSMYMGCHKDPMLIAQIDGFLDRVRHHVASEIEGLKEGEWDLEWHIYGRDVADGETPRELFLVGEARAETQELASNIISASRTASIHGNYPNQKATSGNFAFGIGATSEISLGPCAEFCIYHLMDLQPGEEKALFPIKSFQIDYSASIPRNRAPAMEGNTASPQPAAQKSSLFSVSNIAPVNENISIKRAKTLGDVAKVLRSKNAGPFEITFDVMFDRPDVYEAVKKADFPNTNVIANLYGLKQDQIAWCGFFDKAYAFKATIARTRRGLPATSGGYLENDVHGSQMYVPLMELELPEALSAKLRNLA